MGANIEVLVPVLCPMLVAPGGCCACAGERCAWYVGGAGLCAVRVLAESVSAFRDDENEGSASDGG